MFGLEKKKKEVFQFDLEKELRQDPNKLQALFKETETKINAIKGELRKGADTQNFDALGTLMQGYSVLLRILTRLKAKKE